MDVWTYALETSTMTAPIESFAISDLPAVPAVQVAPTGRLTTTTYVPGQTTIGLAPGGL
jgi:hypothetical protein